MPIKQKHLWKPPLHCNIVMIISLMLSDLTRSCFWINSFYILSLEIIITCVAQKNYLKIRLISTNISDKGSNKVVNINHVSRHIFNFSRESLNLNSQSIYLLQINKTKSHFGWKMEILHIDFWEELFHLNLEPFPLLHGHSTKIQHQRRSSGKLMLFHQDWHCRKHTWNKNEIKCLWI